MPTGGGFKVACFASSVESSCCVSDQYLAQCFDPMCEECIVDAGSSTGYGGAFPKTCDQDGLCIGCQSGGNVCPGECKCQPGVGCGCYTPGTYNPIACTGGGSTCTETNCKCCNSGTLIDRTNTYTVYNIGTTNIGLNEYLTQFTYSYNYASCNSSVVSVSLQLTRRTALGAESSMQTISLPLFGTTGIWTGEILLPSGTQLFADLVVCTTTGGACCSTRHGVWGV